VQIFRTKVLCTAFFNLQKKKAAKTTFVQKGARKMLMKLTPASFANQGNYLHTNAFTNHFKSGQKNLRK